MPIPRDRDVEALVAYLEGRATPEEAEALERRLREDPALAESLAVQARMSVMLDSMSRERSRIREVEEASAPLRPALSRLRPVRVERTSTSPWILGLVAAAVFIAIALFAVSRNPEPEPVAPRGPSAAERRRAETERNRAEERLADLEQERKRLLEKPVSPEKKPESITEEAKKAALVEIEERKRRIESELQAAIARGGTPAPKEEPRPDVKPVPRPDAPPEKKPEEPTQTSIAKVLRISGDAFAVTAGSRKPLSAGQELLSGQGIETGAGTGLVEIAYPDQTRMEIGADAVVRSLAADGGKRVVVEKGALRAEVKPQPKGQPMLFESAQGEAVVLGTTLKFTVAADAKEGTTLEVEEGKVRFRNKLANRSVEVVGGHYSVAAAGLEFSALALPTVLYAAGFDDGKAPGWTFSPKYPWTLRPTPPSGAVLVSPAYAFNDPKAQRGDLTVVLASKVWQDGVFELDARPEELDPANLTSFLVFARFRDQENCLWLEYILNRGAWTVSLLQLNNGTIGTIATGPCAALETGRSYRLRLELKDDEVRTLLDGREMLRGKTSILAPGRLALCPMASRVSFDNIRVTTIPVRPRPEKR